MTHQGNGSNWKSLHQKHSPSNHKGELSASPWKIQAFLSFCIIFLLAAPPCLGFGYQGENSQIIREITIEGVPAKDTRLIREELLSKPGEPISLSTVEADRRHLNRVGLFRSVSIDVRQETDGIELYIFVVPRSSTLPFLSMGGSEGNSFSAGGGVKVLDFPQPGLIFSGKARAGGETRLELQFNNPGLRSEFLNFQFSLRGADRYNDNDLFDEVSFDTELRLSRRLSENFRAGGLLGWFFLDSSKPEITLAGGRGDHIPRLGVFLDYDSRDRLTITHKGWNNEILLSRNGMSGIGDSGFWDLTMDLRRYQPVAERHTLFFSLLSRLRTGSINEDIPLHQDFHIGGTNTVRGWNRNSANGKNELLSTVEYRYRLVEPRKILKGKFGDKLYVGFEFALFADAGKAWGNPDIYGKSDVLAGYGLGLRLLLPFVNVIRFDFAFGESGEGIFSHFGVVPKVDKQLLRIR